MLCSALGFLCGSFVGVCHSLDLSLETAVSNSLELVILIHLYINKSKSNECIYSLFIQSIDPTLGSWSCFVLGFLCGSSTLQYYY